MLSGFTRNTYEAGNHAHLTNQNIEPILQACIKPQPLEAIDIILRYFQRKTGEAPGQYIRLDEINYPLIYGVDGNEISYYVKLLIGDLQYIETNRVSPSAYRLTVKGWERLAQIGLQQKLLDQAFVAMWFDASTEEAYNKGIQPAIEQLHYHPVVMNRLEHNDKICDRIIAEIRKSSILVADFTGHRGGVYFEAGFTLGLGIPVIWTCREDDFDNLHFDTRQYNHIKWTTPEDLKQKLVDRIEATIALRPA